MPQAHQGKLQQAITQRGPALVVALLGALCETCPRNLMRPAAMLLHRLLAMPGLQETARSWLATALQSAELQGAVSSRLQRLRSLLLHVKSPVYHS